MSKQYSPKDYVKKQCSEQLLIAVADLPKIAEVTESYQ